MTSGNPKITICIPHWEVQNYAELCLRSIRKHSCDYDLEVIVVDNGSRDNSIQYLRSLEWIRLIERPEETRDNWPGNFFSALDEGLRCASGEFLVCMHTDVFVKSDRWLDPFLREIGRDESIASSGAWKLELAHPLYLLPKRVAGYVTYCTKRLLGCRKRPIRWTQGDFPRDYCAMYRRSVLLDHQITFQCVNGWTGGGYSVAQQLGRAGFSMGMFPVAEMARHVVHVTHGTAAVTPKRPLNHRRAQVKAEKRVAKLLAEEWVQALAADSKLDGPMCDQRDVA